MRVKRKIEAGDVVVATNLAGRGADFKISREVNTDTGTFKDGRMIYDYDPTAETQIDILPNLIPVKSFSNDDISYAFSGILY